MKDGDGCLRKHLLLQHSKGLASLAPNVTLDFILGSKSPYTSYMTPLMIKLLETLLRKTLLKARCM